MLRKGEIVKQAIELGFVGNKRFISTDGSYRSGIFGGYFKWKGSCLCGVLGTIYDDDLKQWGLLENYENYAQILLDNYEQGDVIPLKNRRHWNIIKTFYERKPKGFEYIFNLYDYEKQ